MWVIIFWFPEGLHKKGLALFPHSHGLPTPTKLYGPFMLFIVTFMILFIWLKSWSWHTSGSVWICVVNQNFNFKKLLFFLFLYLPTRNPYGLEMEFGVALYVNEIAFVTMLLVYTSNLPSTKHGEGTQLSLYYMSTLYKFLVKYVCSRSHFFK